MSKYVIYKDSSGSDDCWRWRLIDSNGEQIAKSDKGYLKSEIVAVIELCQQQGGPDTPIIAAESRRYERYRDSQGEYRWRFIADDGDPKAMSEEGFDSESNVIRSLENLRQEMARAEIEWEDTPNSPDGTDTEGMPGS